MFFPRLITPPALDEGFPVLDAAFLRDLTIEQCRHVFRADPGSPDIPMLVERHNIMREAGAKLMDNFDGSIVECVRHAHGSAQQLIRFLAEHFPSFRDEHVYHGERGRNGQIGFMCSSGAMMCVLPPPFALSLRTVI